MTSEDVRNIRLFSNWFFYASFHGDAMILFNHHKVLKILHSFDSRILYPSKYKVKWTLLTGEEFDVVSLGLLFNLSSSDCVKDLILEGKTSAKYCELMEMEFSSSIIF